jgi:hypothetical protein
LLGYTKLTGTASRPPASRKRLSEWAASTCSSARDTSRAVF